MWTSTIFAIFFNIFINPIALGSIGWKYYLVFVVVLITMVITVWFWYPETRGHSLEQMAVLFDGDEAEVAVPGETRERTMSVVSVISERKRQASMHIEEVDSKEKV
jgi:Sugar (and other) transporter